MRKKLRDCGGLTFVEMMCATVILILLCLMTNTGMQMALASYRTLTGEAETQVLLSSLSDALADKLRYCVVTEASGTYTSSVGAVTVADGSVSGVPEGTVLVGAGKLLPAGAYGEPDASGNRRYQVTEASVTEPVYTVGVNPVFSVNLKVKDRQTNLTREASFTVRCLNPVKKEGPP